MSLQTLRFCKTDSQSSFAPQKSQNTLLSRSERRLLIQSLALPLVLLMAGVVAADQPSMDSYALPVDGDVFSAKLIRVDVDWKIQLAAQETELRMAAGDLVSWGQRAEPDRGSMIMMGDGTLLVASVIDIHQDVVHVESDLWDETRIPVESVRGIVFTPPLKRPERDQLVDQIRGESEPTDKLLLESGDIIRGRLVARNDEHFQWESPEGTVQVSTERVKALVLNPSLVKSLDGDKRRALLGMRDGSLLVADKAIVGGAGDHVQLVGGVRLVPFADASLIEQVVLIRPVSPDVTYLSDLKPNSYKHVPLLDLAWPYKKDRNVRDGWLRTGGQLHTKGLGMHSTSRLTYRLARGFRRFESLVGIDDQTEGRGSVVFRVFLAGGDGKWEMAYKSPVVRGGDPPVTVSVPLDDARVLSLVVDFTDRGDQLDHANWLSARLVR